MKGLISEANVLNLETIAISYSRHFISVGKIIIKPVMQWFYDLTRPPTSSYFYTSGFAAMLQHQK